jgi:hypothetical protein
MGKLPHSHTAKDIIETAEKEQKAVMMRKAGSTHQEIADALGWKTEKSARNAIQRVLARTRKLTTETAEEMKQLIIARLDEMLLPQLARARKGEHLAVDAVVKIDAQRAKLLGLYPADRVEHTGVEGGPIQTVTVVEMPFPVVPPEPEPEKRG